VGEVWAFAVGLTYTHCQLPVIANCAATIMMLIIVDPQVSVMTDDATNFSSAHATATGQGKMIGFRC
jgi:hypothetical protein